MWEYEEEIINQLNTIQCTNSLQLQNYPHNKELTHKHQRNDNQDTKVYLVRSKPTYIHGL